MEYSDGQIKVFEIIDNLIDDDIDVQEYIRDNGAFRKRINRNFAGVGENSRVVTALLEYGFSFEDNGSLPDSGEIESLLYIDENYLVNRDVEFAQYLSDKYSITVLEINKLITDDLIREYRLSSLEKFVQDHDEDFLADYENYRNLGIRRYIRAEFGGFREFMKAFNINPLLSPNKTIYGHRYFTDAGREFEALIKQAFVGGGILVDSAFYLDGCYPDFVLEGSEWADAKLSKSTSFNPNCQTIEKYTRHTDYLTLIYAIDDMPDDEVPELPEGVRLLHVFDYFPDISPGLRSEIQTLIDEVSTRKGRRVNRT
ncbi:hypothetical protein [Sporosarcina koreensis]|uniref:hypothetical protein n=1 Tax=Sporosarcina koreensis TaxID=334735 RepID=UPI00075D047D|nr:hypothetical protein [Sporosarcina koreensis]